MSRTYKATGIILKAIPLGESDRLLTILTPEFGLMRVVAPGARKSRSRLGGTTGLFVVNQWLIAKGRSLDKITQAEIINSHSGLAKNLGKLAAGQYLAELVLSQALSEQPQPELFLLFSEHLDRLEGLPNTSTEENAISIVARLTHGIFHLLAWAGIAPQVQLCCLTQHPLNPNLSDPNWLVGFSLAAGGIINLAALSRIQSQHNHHQSSSVSEAGGQYLTEEISIKIDARLAAEPLAILQHLAQSELTNLWNTYQPSAWITVEKILRRYAEYQFARSIQSASLIDSWLLNCYPGNCYT